MATAPTLPAAPKPGPVAVPALEAKLGKGPGKIGVLTFAVVLIIGVVYAGSHLLSDLSGVHNTSILPYVLLGIALLVALGFEFVNGFHDTANAVATVIYTHSLEPHVAVVWSGFWNFMGVLTSSGLVAFGIISLLPVELILQVGSKAGFAMVFALLVAAIIWNLSTWYFGLPASSSHTLIGSIIGVGIANQLMSARTGTSGVDWAQALNIGKSLLLSPIVGFLLAGLLLLVMKAVVKNRKLYEAPEGTEPPPFWIRALLVLTCTGVSFAHGSNDGQKGMGLIMLILIGTVPTAYALNHAVTKRQSQDFVAVSQQAANTLDKYVSPNAVICDAREDVTTFIRTREFTPNTMLALRQLVSDIGNETVLFGELARVPNDRVRNFRNDMYLVSEALRLMQKTHQPRYFSRRLAGSCELQEAHRQRHQVYPRLGEGRGGDGAGIGHDGGLEAHRRDGRRKNRQRPPDLRAGRGRGDHRHGHHRRGRLVRFAGQHHPCAFVGYCRHHGGEPHRTAVGDGAQSGDGLGADPAGLHDAGRLLVLGL